MRERGKPDSPKSLLTRMEEPMRLVMKMTEAFNRHDVPGLMACFNDDCLFESPFPPPDGGIYRGRQAVSRYWEAFFSSSPQAHFEIEELIGLGFRAVLRWKYTWVDTEGKAGHVRGVDVFRIAGGLICEKLSYVKG